MKAPSTVLRLNAASCLFFGAILAIDPAATAGFVGVGPSWAYRVLGLLLLGNGAHLLWASLQVPLKPQWLLWFSAGDLLWWSASMALLAGPVPPGPGAIAVLLIAIGVAGLGLAQLWALDRARGTTAPFRRMLQQWLGLPAWVKLWLTALNLAFWVAPLLLPWDTARIILLAYLASGPILFAIALLAGGLTRVVGLGHVLPWVPLLIWLWPQTGALYPATLWLMIALCLVLDVADAIKWLNGDRVPAGTPRSGVA